jgi:hypothetical protein
VRGKVIDVQWKNEDPRNIALDMAGNAVSTALKLPLYVIPGAYDILSRSQKRMKPTQPKQVWNIILEILDDFPHTHPYLIVEMSGRKTRGIIRSGDEVIVTGKLNKKANIFIAKYLQSVRTGEKIYCSRF